MGDSQISILVWIANTVTGAATGSAYCNYQSGTCCAFYLGASDLAAGNYSVTVNTPQCSATRTFSLSASTPAKQLKGYGAQCPN